MAKAKTTKKQTTTRAKISNSDLLINRKIEKYQYEMDKISETIPTKFTKFNGFGDITYIDDMFLIYKRYVNTSVNHKLLHRNMNKPNDVIEHTRPHPNQYIDNHEIQSLNVGYRDSQHSLHGTENQYERVVIKIIREPLKSVRIATTTEDKKYIRNIIDSIRTGDILHNNVNLIELSNHVMCDVEPLVPSVANQFSFEEYNNIVMSHAETNAKDTNIKREATVNIKSKDILGTVVEE